MKAFIMSAGIGTRLRPLTYEVPKPMVPMANRPVLENTLMLLKTYGINDIIMNLHVMPRYIKNYFGNGKKFGLNINYSYEKSLLGTAGGLKKVEDFFAGEGNFIVLSGDGLIDVNLKNIIDFHIKKKAIASIVLKKVDAKFEYGLVFENSKKRITKFVEKPFWSDVSGGAANTGIYVFNKKIFKYIPKNKFYDFGNDVWPKFVKNKIPIYGYETDSYWCDVGNLYEYRRASQDILKGNLLFNISGKKLKKNVYIGKNSKIDKTAKIVAPCVIGDNVKIGKNVVLNKFTIIGNNCNINTNSRLNNTILWNNISIEKNVLLDNCIIGNNAIIKNDMIIHNGIILK